MIFVRGKVDSSRHKRIMSTGRNSRKFPRLSNSRFYAERVWGIVTVR